MNTVVTKPNIILSNLIYRQPNLTSKRIANLAGSLRKSVGLKMLKKIQTARKNDW